MRLRFEATDATGKVYKRNSRSRVYSHCVAIHFAAYPAPVMKTMGILVVSALAATVAWLFATITLT